MWIIYLEMLLTLLLMSPFSPLSSHHNQNYSTSVCHYKFHQKGTITHGHSILSSAIQEREKGKGKCIINKPQFKQMTSNPVSNPTSQNISAFYKHKIIINPNSLDTYFFHELFSLLCFLFSQNHYQWWMWSLVTGQ